MTWLLAQVSTRHTNSLSLGLAPSDGGKNYDVENKTGVLYNDTVQQFGKGM
jgi:hypothetical protein